MLYASKLYQRNNLLRDKGVEENPEDLYDLVAEVLVGAVERRLQRNLGRQYRKHEAILTRVRGQIDILTTASRMLLSQGRIACKFDELSVDNLTNRLLHAALDIASRRVADSTLERRCRNLAVLFTQYGVSSQQLSARDAARITLGRNEREDAEAVDAARLLMEMSIPAEQSGPTTTRNAERDAALIRQLYEAAVRGFYRASLTPEWSVEVGETQHHWPLTAATPGLAAILPSMKTDTLIQSKERRIIVETKFADALKPNQYGSLRLSRDHIFQLYAYVQSQHGVDELSCSTEGVLLYPVVGRHLDESATIQGHRYRFMTVDLRASARDIRETLLSVVDA